jgi:hypothetical protein
MPQLLLRRRGLWFPGGNPSFDPSHLAARAASGGDHFILSAVASGSGINFLLAPTVVTPLSPTILGSPTGIIDPTIGPAVKFGAGSSYSWGYSQAFSALTETTAVIFVPNVLNANHKYLMQFGATTVGTYDSGANQLSIFNALGIAGFFSGLPVVAGVPYFAIWSTGPTATNVLLLRLNTGSIVTAVGAGLTLGSQQGTTTNIGSDQYGDDCLCSIAAVACVPAFLGLAQMRQWAADPWSFWYPAPINAIAFDPAWVKASSAGAVGVPYNPWLQRAPILAQ